MKEKVYIINTVCRCIRNRCWLRMSKTTLITNIFIQLSHFHHFFLRTLFFFLKVNYRNCFVPPILKLLRCITIWWELGRSSNFPMQDELGNLSSKTRTQIPASFILCSWLLGSSKQCWVLVSLGDRSPEQETNFIEFFYFFWKFILPFKLSLM